MKLLSQDYTMKVANYLSPIILMTIGLCAMLFVLSMDSSKLSSEGHIRHSHFGTGRRLRDHQEKLSRDELDRIAQGNASFVANKTIFGAIIMTDYSVDHKSRIEHSNSTDEKLKASMKLSEQRSTHAREMISNLPFPVVHWPPVFTKACPFSDSQHRTERGLLYAHYRIWLDFVYFDNELLSESRNKTEGGFTENSESGYANGTFVVSKNGTLLKHGSPFRDENIIVIFEDDADIAVTDIHEALRRELTDMSTDLLFLGWCLGRLSRPVPLCTHAYALTLEGARKVIKYTEPCGLALDEQFVIMAKNKWITYRSAHTENYVHKFNANYPVQYDTTHGLFHQKKLGSFNGH
jgi:hypothetical protein